MGVETLDGLLSIKGPTGRYGQIIYDLSLIQDFGIERLVITFGVQDKMGARRRISAHLRSKQINPKYFIISTYARADLKGTSLENLHPHKIASRKWLLWLPIPFTGEHYKRSIPEHVQISIVDKVQSIIKTAREFYGENVFLEGQEALNY